jgi:uncharacterized membrane protein
MGGEGLLEIDETAVIVKKPDGKIRVSQDRDIVENSQHVGHIAGLVTAALTGTLPFILVGTIDGELNGKLLDHDITNKFLKTLQKELQPNTSVLVLFARSDAATSADHKAVSDFDPKILESDLPPELAQNSSQNGRSRSSKQTGP